MLSPFDIGKKKEKPFSPVLSSSFCKDSFGAERFLGRLDVFLKNNIDQLCLSDIKKGSILTIVVGGETFRKGWTFNLCCLL
jgi:hypothetical protein